MNAKFPDENFAGAILDDKTVKSLEFRHLININKYRSIWMKSFANELSRLAQVIRDISGTDTIKFIPYYDVPVQTTVTYGQTVCTYRPQKDKKHCMRLNVGGNLIVCLFDVSAPTSDLTTAKLLFNSVISTPGTGFVTLDLNNFYLGTPLPEARYMKMKLDILPDEIIKKNTLLNIVPNGWVYFRIKKVMYGLK